MKTKRNIKETGNVLICVLGTILIVSLIGATVLSNSTTRLNASTKQVRGWKEALSAAETGGDIAYAEIRKSVSTDPLVRASQWVGWTQVGTTYTSPVTTLGSSTISPYAQTVVETCYFDQSGVFHTTPNPDPFANNWYRVRSKGTAPLPNLKRTGMDDALTNDGLMHFAAFGSTAMHDITERGKGDSLLRKIDFNTDHFIATYGPLGDGVGKALVAVATPQIARRIEQIVSPVPPFFDAAIKAAGSFRGLGSAAYIDSYDSRNGPYDSSVKDNPASPYYKDSRHGSVQIGNATATVMGTIYGDVATDGGNVTGKTSNVTGTIDNNVPFTLVDYVMPPTTIVDGGRDNWVYVPPGPQSWQLPSAVTSTQTVAPLAGGTTNTPTYYIISSLSGKLTVNPAKVLIGNPPVLTPVDTYVAIHVTDGVGGGDITAGITVNPLVHLKIYFDGNINVKNSALVNNSPSSANPYAANLQFYGISPPPGTSQSIMLTSGPPATLAATFYAPSADMHEAGNPDFIGTVVCKTFYSNGNISWHYDRRLNDDGQVLDFRIASYVEDTR